MKRVLSAIFLVLLALNINAQVETEIAKNFRFGLKAMPNIGWLSEDRSETERDGLALGFGYGLQTEFRLSNNASFVTGLEVDQIAGGLTFKDSTSNFHNISLIYANGNDTANILSRKYKFNSVNIPLTIKMKTKEIGYMTYWGQFGLNTSYIYKARTVKNNVMLNGSPAELKDEFAELDILGETNALRLGLNIGLGTEYAIAGSTALLVGINWNNGFTRSLKKNSESIIGIGTDNEYTFLPQTVSNSAVQLTIGILF